MSNYSLLTPNNSQKKTPKSFQNIFIIAIILLVGLLAGGFVLIKKDLLTETNTNLTTTEKEQDRRIKEQARRTVLSYLAMPTFAGTTLELQILGQAHLELFDVSKQEVYFSLPNLTDQDGKALDFKSLTTNFLIDSTKTELATEQQGLFKLGRFSLPKSDKKAVFFRTSVENVKVDPNETLRFSFQRGVYQITIDQLSDFLTNKNIYGGKLEAIAEQSSSKTGTNLVFANHGALVAKTNDPSLKQFVTTLTKDIAADDPLVREKKIQRLLDLVTNEIEYDKTESLASFETLKRPNETLMNRGADCSNKAILMASLLEQLGEDYLLLYCPNHITVAVKQGKFPNDNNLTFNWENKTWVIAETTAPNFEIGTDKLQKESIFHQVQYVQRPSQKDLIFNANNGKTVLFR